MIGPACAAIISQFSPPPSPMEISSLQAGFSALAAAAWSGYAVSKICTVAPEDCARYATSGGVSRKFVGTQVAPIIQLANIVSSTALELRACSRIRSPCCTPDAASAPAAAWTRSRNEAQVQVVSRQMIAGRSGKRRAVWSSIEARLLVGIMASAQRLQDRDVVGHRRPAHVEHRAPVRLRQLHPARR